MPEFISFFIVLAAGLFFSEIFKRFHLPWVVALIVGGIIIGPSVLGWFEPNETIDFLGQIGLVFLMFIAGLESRLGHFKEMGKRVGLLSLLNGLVPFIVGAAVGYMFGYDLVASLLLGVIFISSSIAVVVPSLERNKILHSRLGKSIVATTIFQDVASLIILSVILQSVSPITALPLPIFYGLLFIFLIALRWLIPKVELFFRRKLATDEDIFQQELRMVFVMLIGTVIVFELLGLHPIIAGFFAGLVLSGTLKGNIMKRKLHTISYGLFIPIFFIVVGAQTDITALRHIGLFAAVIILTSMASKFISGFFGAKLSGFSIKESKLIGASTIPQLSTTFAVAFLGFEVGLIDEQVVTAMIILGIVTTFIAPILINRFTRDILQLKK